MLTRQTRKKVADEVEERATYLNDAPTVPLTCATWIGLHRPRDDGQLSLLGLGVSGRTTLKSMVEARLRPSFRVIMPALDHL